MDPPITEELLLTLSTVSSFDRTISSSFSINLAWVQEHFPTELTVEGSRRVGEME